MLMLEADRFYNPPTVHDSENQINIEKIFWGNRFVLHLFLSLIYHRIQIVKRFKKF
jgi:hypothetical protein